MSQLDFEQEILEPIAVAGLAAIQKAYVNFEILRFQLHRSYPRPSCFRLPPFQSAFETAPFDEAHKSAKMAVRRNQIERRNRVSKTY